MDDATSESGSTSAGAGEVDRLPVISKLVVDVAPALQSETQQSALTDFIWHMLDRDYQIYLCSSTTREGGAEALAGESFAHPHLTWLRGEMPPGQPTLGRLPALVAGTTLWISDDPRVLSWVRERGLGYISILNKTASFATDLQLSGWGELADLLDPTAQTVRQVAAAIAELRRSRAVGPIIVGIGGPPESGYERFAMELKRALEAASAPLVDLLDVSSFLNGELEQESARDEPTPSFPVSAGDAWLLKQVLQQLAKGESVHVEIAPDIVPRDFRNHFPLYVSSESVVLVLGETVFQKALRETMHLAILIEVAPEETARRLYEIPDGETFDDRFTQQYLEHDGRRYSEYLSQHQVVAAAEIHISANSPLKFVLRPIDSRLNKYI